MDHNTFMKQIGSVVVILINSGNFFEGNLKIHIFEASCIFYVWKTFLDLHQEKLSFNADIEMPYCKKLFMFLNKKIKKLKKKKNSVFNGPPPNTIKHT